MSLNKLLLPQEAHAICLGDRWFQGFYFMDIYTACLGHFRVPKTITSYRQLRTWPRFETEVWSNSQMVYWIRLLHMYTYVTIYCYNTHMCIYQCEENAPNTDSVLPQLR